MYKRVHRPFLGFLVLLVTVLLFIAGQMWTLVYMDRIQTQRSVEYFSDLRILDDLAFSVLKSLSHARQEFFHSGERKGLFRLDEEIGTAIDKLETMAGTEPDSELRDSLEMSAGWLKAFKWDLSLFLDLLLRNARAEAGWKAEIGRSAKEVETDLRNAGQGKLLETFTSLRAEAGRFFETRHPAHAKIALATIWEFTRRLEAADAIPEKSRARLRRHGRSYGSTFSDLAEMNTEIMDVFNSLIRMSQEIQKSLQRSDALLHAAFENQRERTENIWSRLKFLSMAFGLFLILGVGYLGLRTYRSLTRNWVRAQLADRIASIVLSSTGTEDLFPAMMKELRHYIPGERCGIFSYNPETGKSTRWYLDSDYQFFPSDFLQRRSSGYYWGEDLYRKREPIIIPDLLNAPYKFGSVLAREGFRSILLVPIVKDHEYYAHIHFSSKKIAAFTHFHRDMLVEVSQLIGNAVSKVQLNNEILQSSERLRAQNRIALASSSTLDSEELLNHLANELLLIFEADKCSLLGWRSKVMEEDYFLAQSGIQSDRPALGFPDFHEDVLRPLYDLHQPVSVPKLADLDSEWAKVRMSEGLSSFYAFPIMIGGKCRAHAALFWKAEKTPTDNERQLAEALGRQIGIALRNVQLHAESEERNERLNVQNAIVRAALSAMEPEDQFREIAKEIKALLPYENCIIASINHELNIWTFFYADLPEDFRPSASPTQTSFVREVYDKKQQLYIPDMREVDKDSARQFVGWGLMSLVATPILQAGECIAHIVLLRKDVNGFSFRDKIMLLELSAPLGAVIHNTMLNHGLKNRLLELEQLQEASKSLTLDLELNDILDSVWDGCRALIKSTRILIWLRDKDTFEPQIAYRKNISSEYINEFMKYYDDSIISPKNFGHSPVALENIFTDERYIVPHAAAEKEGIGAMLVLPLIYKGDLFGSISLYWDAPRKISEEEIKVARTYSDHAAIAIQNADLYQSAKESRAFYQSILEDSGDAMYIADVQGVIHRWNRAAERMFGYKEHEVRGQNVSVLLPKWESGEVGETRPPGESEEPILFDAVRVRKDGTEIPVNVSLAPIKEEGRKPRFVFATYRDLTEKEKVRIERESLIRELQRKNEDLERFMYTVSHDLKSPLITVQGFIGQVGKSALAGNHDRMMEDIERIRQASQRMRTLLEGLLEFSRVGRGPMPRDPVPLEEVAKEAVENLSRGIALRDVDVKIHPDLPVVMGDRVRLSQVFQNLLENAIKFIGGQKAPLIEIGSMKRGEDTIFFVRDNGVGIDPKYHEKVFGLFDRLDTDTEGTGIGLALVRQIVEMHNGRIWVESEGKGQGCTFCGFIPLAEEGVPHA